MRDRKRQVASGVLSTDELMRFINTISMLKISKDNKLSVKIFDHKVPNNTWSVSLFTKKCHREVVIKALLTGHLTRWIDKFGIKMHYDENNLPPIPDGYELIKSYEHLEGTDMFLHEGKWLPATSPIFEIKAIMTGISIYHGNLPVIRKKADEEI